MMSLPSLARVLTVCLTGFALASCKNTSNPMAINDPYATNAVGGGGYNPYTTAPGGTVANTPAAPTYTQAPTYQQPSYEAPPAPAPEPDPYSYEAPKTTPKKTTSSSSKRYTVKKGDGLYGIARKYGTTVTKLKSANGLTSDLIRIGQVLKIP